MDAYFPLEISAIGIVAEQPTYCRRSPDRGKFWQRSNCSLPTVVTGNSETDAVLFQCATAEPALDAVDPKKAAHRNRHCTIAVGSGSSSSSSNGDAIIYEVFYSPWRDKNSRQRVAKSSGIWLTRLRVDFSPSRVATSSPPSVSSLLLLLLLLPDRSPQASENRFVPSSPNWSKSVAQASPRTQRNLESGRSSWRPIQSRSRIPPRC